MFEESAHIDVTELLNFNDTEIKFVRTDANRADAGSETSRPDIGADPSLELGAQASMLRGLLYEFKSLTERACDTAVRQAQHSAEVEELAGAELVSVRLQLKEKDEALEAREAALREREAAAKEKIDSLEIILRDKDAQLESCHARSGALLGEIDGLNQRLNEAAMAMKQAETRFRDFAKHQEGKIYELRDEVKVKADLLQDKDAALRQLDEESRIAIAALETRFETAAAQLESKEAELREKEAALQAVTARDEAISQLMQQLAAESQKLMTELREKNRLMSELETKTYHSFDNAVAWNNGATTQERLL